MSGVPAAAGLPGGPAHRSDGPAHRSGGSGGPAVGTAPGPKTAGALTSASVKPAVRTRER
ncbi:hypothetical protein [Streptomyces sp. NPDC048638]|uniref:hypothetical protein n=1 Tax=Streptomyces sp. NPDC048638 TaxID=3365580 RepID=UPI00371204FD